MVPIQPPDVVFRFLDVMDEETGQLLELAEIGGALTSSGGQHNVRRGG